jgi:membrane protein YdbS with pleckstrin-like domain
MDAVTETQTVLLMPRNTLDPRAIPAWRVTTGAAALIGLASWIGILIVLRQTGAYTNAPVFGVLLLAGVAVTTLLAWYGPRIEWRHWRYEIRDEEIDLQSGMVTITRTLIPMARVQHVDFRQGLIERRFGLATIVVHTAAGSREIPGLAATEAGPIRSRIAALANIHDDL